MHENCRSNMPLVVSKTSWIETHERAWPVTGPCPSKCGSLNIFIMFFFLHPGCIQHLHSGITVLGFCKWWFSIIADHISICTKYKLQHNSSRLFSIGLISPGLFPHAWKGSKWKNFHWKFINHKFPEKFL